MTRRTLRARDVERLENTTFADLSLTVGPPAVLVDYTQTCPTPWGTWTCGCEICVAPSDCCVLETDPREFVSPLVPGGVGWRQE